MMENIKKIPKYIWILSAIFIVGVFLRTYHFQKNLRFNNDQARDAGVVNDIITGKTGFPLLGPVAGGTPFKLGPAFYYIEYASARVFGNTPDKLAYPDLASSILAILLLFFFLRLYFSKSVSLTLTFLFAVSLYGVHYSRFAWNPNSMPFWTLLFIFSLLKLFGPSRIPKYVWGILAGMALGIGVQLHTLLLGILPIYLLGVFVWAVWKKAPIKKYFAVILIIAFVFNLPQVISELNTSFSNTRHFLTAQKIKRSGKDSLVQSSMLALTCTAQADSFILSGLGDQNSCVQSAKKSFDENVFLLRMGAGLLLIFGGGFLIYQKVKKETDLARKNFLLFVGAYGLLYLLIVIPIVQSIADKAMRYYLGMVFIPFFLLGLLLEWLIGSLKDRSGLLIGLVVVGLAVSNLAAVRNDITLSKMDVSIFTLGEGEGMARYIAAQTAPTHQALITGSSAVMFHEFKSLQFLAKEQGLTLERYSAKKNGAVSEKIFSIAFSPASKETSGQRFGRFVVTSEVSTGSNGI